MVLKIASTFLSSSGPPARRMVTSASCLALTNASGPSAQTGEANPNVIKAHTRQNRRRFIGIFHLVQKKKLSRSLYAGGSQKLPSKKAVRFPAFPPPEAGRCSGAATRRAPAPPFPNAPSAGVGRVEVAAHLCFQEFGG